MKNRLPFICILAAAAVAVSPSDSQTAQPPDLNGFWTHGFSLGFDSAARRRRRTGP